ncbi:hypothetical protein D3C75_978230 [compost metagenome]
MLTTPTSHWPASMAWITALSSENTSVDRLLTQPLTICSVFASPWVSIRVAVSDWLYTFFAVRRHRRPSHCLSARAS